VALSFRNKHTTIDKNISSIDLTTMRKIRQEVLQWDIFKEWFGKYKIGDELPEGWRVGKYGELVNLSSGKGVKKSEYIENGFV
jgi:type I restriction enzyme S subunit